MAPALPDPGVGCCLGSGLNLCCGTAAEGLEDPRTELCPLVKYFAERKKIFNIHFRNVRCIPLTWSLRPCQRRGSDHAWLPRQVVGGHDKGTGLPDFSEVWPDEGDVGAQPTTQPASNLLGIDRGFARASLREPACPGFRACERERGLR